MYTEKDNEDAFRNIELEEIFDFILNSDVLHKMRSSGYYLIGIPPNLLNEPLTSSTIDSYYGLLSFYKWHETPIENGGEFSHIFYLIQKLKSKFLESEKTLDIISRKTAYLNIARMEIEHISKRYNWSESQEFEEVFLSKFEDFATSLVELIILCINLYEKLKLGHTIKEVENFQEILDFFIDSTNSLPNYYHLGINHSINFSVYIFIRNSIVHNFDEIDYIENTKSKQNPLLKINNIPYKKRAGFFNEYISKEFETNYTGKKTPQSFQEYIDNRFPYIKFEFFLTKKSTVNLEETKIGFEMDVISVTKKMLSDLYRVQRDLFENIIA